MRVHVMLVPFILLTLLSCSCSDGDRILSGPDADLTGVWGFLADGFSTPQTLACNDEHSGLSGMQLCSAFDIDFQFQEKDSLYTGASTRAFCGADFSATVSVNGSAVGGEIVADDGVDVWHITFSGTVIGAAGSIQPDSLQVEGLSGICTTIGDYNLASISLPQ